MSSTDVFERLRESIERNLADRLAAALNVPIPTAEGNRPGNTAGPRQHDRCTSRAQVDAALALVDRAASHLHRLQTQCDQLEVFAKQSAARAERDVAAVQAHVEALQDRVAMTETAIDDATLRLAEAEFRAEQAERCAAEAQRWLDAFYKRILACLDEHAPLAAPQYPTKLAA